MYVVTRTFRDSNGVFSVGSIVDPTEVKTFKSRLQQRHIVDVNELNVERWATFFKNRYGIDLKEKFAEQLREQISVAKPQTVTKVKTVESDW